MLRLVYRILDNWPLKRQLGYYAYLPAFFAVGAAVEFLMIHMRINNVDFYSVYMEKEQQRLQQEAQCALYDDRRSLEHCLCTRLIRNRPTMPFGLSWPTYLTRVTISLMAVAAGSQCVHSIYRPIDKRLSQLLDDKKEQYARRVEESTTTKPPK